jgi:putative glycosyltransferase (exosortase G-associated)
MSVLKSLLTSLVNILIRMKNSAFVWGAWLIVPVIMEFAPAIRGALLLRKRYKTYKNRSEKLEFVPEITIIIPVYNSKDTLYNCIKSVHESSYPNNRMNIILVDNKGSKEDFMEFQRAQNDFTELRMQWIESEQGKSKAMNKALYNSRGQYIINVDSDGTFEEHAIENMILKFEDDQSINCMTGAILTNPDDIESFRLGPKRLLKKLEFMEYAQAFLAGRSYSAHDNNIYTLSGAFSAFRKSAVLTSRLYNTDTICEDTQMTFQIKYIESDKVDICEDAIYFVEPISGLDELYTQRQRWQRGSLEVGKMFFNRFSLLHAFDDTNMRTLMYDHTFAFPRMIWYVVTIYFIATNYATNILVITFILLYIMYVIIAFSYFLTAKKFLKKIKKARWYYLRNWWCLVILPLYNFLVFLIRFSGVINSIGTDSSWKTVTLKQEREKIWNTIRADFGMGNRHDEQETAKEK